MKNIVIFIFLISQFCFADNPPEISIITCSPGDEIYSVFGHSAIRIVDKENAIDVIYNFGMFDFDTPNFAFKFIKGKLKYHLGIQKTEDFIRQYTHENRLVSEQKLNLNEREKNKIIAKLNFLYRPENRYYFYSFLEKNCSTEIRDLLHEIDVKFPNQQLEKSNRELINSYLEQNPWLRFGINLMLGKSLDKKTDIYQSMFLPRYLKGAIDNSYLNGKKLVKSEQVLNTVVSEDEFSIENWISSLIVFSLLLLIFFFWFPKPVELIIFFLIGGIGLLLAFMWLFSAHPEVKYNLNIIWCNPLYLIYIPVILKNKYSIFLASVLIVTIISVIFIWLFNFQSFDIAIVPILIILGIINFRQLNKTSETIWQVVTK